jgi:hypothetical protein
MLIMGESNETGSLPIQQFSDAQASILDFLFPGFTRMSAAVQGYLTIDLNVYIPLLCFFGLLVFVCKRICEYLWELLETYYSKNSLYPSKRTHFLIISSFNCLSSISRGCVSYAYVMGIFSELRQERSLLPCHYRLGLFIKPLEK